MITDKLKTDLIDAMRAKDTVRLEVIRFINAQIKYQEIELRASGKELTDEDVLNVLTRESKKRNESISVYRSSGRNDLVDEEEAQLKIIQEYLPKQMSNEEVELMIKSEIDKLPESDKNFNNAIKIIIPLVKGKADGKLVAETVKKLLG